MYFKGTSLLSIILDTGIDLTTNVVELKILYQKPDLTKGSWTGSVFETTKIKVDLTTGSAIDQSGPWRVQAYVKKTGNLEGFGNIATCDFMQNLL